MGWMELVGSIAGAAFGQTATPAIPGNQQIAFGAYNVGGVQTNGGAAAAGQSWMTLAALGAMALVAVIALKKVR